MAARPWCLLLTLTPLVSACATGKPDSAAEMNAPPQAAAPAPVLRGSRCQGAACVCRDPSDKKLEEPRPAQGEKRIEIRMSAANGRLSLDSPTVGHFEHRGLEEACFYVDLPVGKIHDFRLSSHEGSQGSGVTPKVHIAEYGPAGPWWYDILDITCGAGERGCDPELARDWGESWLEHRKRGRLEACGSMMITGLKWSTSGGQAAQNGGLLRDFQADFSLEAKRFATEFPPGANECRIGH